jgi:rubrerythrin
MNVVHEDVEQCVENELQHAVSVFGLHHSWHEKYAVTLEEVQECVDEAARMRSFLESVFDQIKENKPDKAEHLIQFVEDHAIRCAIEAIQVAAMCKKEIEKPEELAEPAELSDRGLYSGHDPVRVFRCTNCGNDFVAGIHPHPFFCPRCGEKFSNVLLL